MNKIQFEFHPRNNELEKEIDFISYNDMNFRNDFPGTLKFFMDSLFCLLKSYRETESEIDRENIEEFLYRRASSIPYVNDVIFRRWNCVLSNEQFNYLRQLLNYIDGLRISFRTKQKNVFDVIRFLSKECSLQLHRNNKLDDIILFAGNYIKKCNLQGCYVEAKNGVGYIGFHGIQREIMIISHWNEVKYDNSHYCKILIVKDEPSEINSNFLKVNKVIEINKVNTDGNLETISHMSEAWFLANRLHKIRRQIDKWLIDERKKENLNNSIESTISHLRRVDEISYHFKSQKLIDETCTLMDYAKKYLDQSLDILGDVDTHDQFKSHLVLIKLSIIDIIRGAKNESNLQHYIELSLGEFKINNALYILSGSGRVKDERISFGEENLSSIMASNIRCLFNDNRIIVDCESRVGAGRTDIQVKRGRACLGIIECKLIRGSEDVSKKTRDGIHQLYDRYSENISFNLGRETQLYLVIFTYDKVFSKIEKSIKIAIDQYKERNSLSMKLLKRSDNSIQFEYMSEEVGVLFSSKRKVITVYVCNLEIDYAKRTAEAVKI